VKNYFSLLDPLRFAAALSVAVFHLMFWSWAWSSVFGVAPGFDHYVGADVQFPSAAPYTWFGFVGVEIFFVISGFVIANSASKSSATGFLFSRALRLYPAVWVCSTLTFIVLLVFAGGKASEFILPYIRAMLLIPKGISGQWLDCIYWTLAAEMAFYGLVFCAMLTKRITLRHLAWGLTIYSAVFNGFALLVLSGTIQSDLLYWTILMFRVPAATWLLSHGCFFALGIWLFISASRKLATLEQGAVAVTCLAGGAEIYYFSSFLLTNIPAIADQSALVPIGVWAAAVLLIAVAANRSRRSTVIASPEPAGYRLGDDPCPDRCRPGCLAVRLGQPRPARPALLVHLRKDRARHQAFCERSLCKLQAASESGGAVAPSKPAFRAGPFAAHPCTSELLGAVARCLRRARADVGGIAQRPSPSPQPQASHDFDRCREDQRAKRHLRESLHRPLDQYAMNHAAGDDDDGEEHVGDTPSPQSQSPPQRRQKRDGEDRPHGDHAPGRERRRRRK
jgi:peptidoglycan/LPS O-acetylase OafA/YrhL